MVYRVLVAVDGTEASNTALEIACALADSYEAALGLLTVKRPEEVSDDAILGARMEGLIQQGSSFSDMYEAYSLASPRDDVSRVAQASRLAAVIADAIIEQAAAFSADKPFQAIKTFVASGDPAEAILACAKNNAADIIIMGHDQQGRAEALFHGSVAEEVQRKAHCPVLIYCLPKA